MKTRMLRDIEVSEVGMGCMAFSHGYGQIPDEQYSIEAIQNAYQRTTSAVGKAIRRNSATLKYGTFVYLVNGRETITE